MKRKTAVLLATIGLLATLTTVFAAAWYYSGTVSTTSVDWLVTINSIPTETTRYQNVALSGIVYLGPTPQSGVLVTIFLNNTTTGITALTDGSGNWAANYNNTHPAGTLLNFKAGVFQ